MNAKRSVIAVSTLAAGAVLVSVVCGQEWGSFPYVPADWANRNPPPYISQSGPQYALYPPVYYSYRVARTYGYSPFAYPSGVLTPGSAPLYATAQMVGDAQARPRPEPLLIDNPFVKQRGPAVTGVRRSTARKPQVVYPATFAK
jgi:hypothetical protein